MKKNNLQQSVLNFFSTPWGMLVLFIVLFYALTFLVYYFYSPGPEERSMAEEAQKQPPMVVGAAVQQSSVSVQNDLLGSQQTQAVQ